MPVIKRTIVKDMPNGDRYVAHLEARIAEDGERFVGGLSPTFSLTGDLFKKKGTRSGRTRHLHYERENGNVGPAAEPDGGERDELTRVMPQLATFARMHLSDPDGGVPMHAEANGWYWYQGSRSDIIRDRFNGGNGDIYAWRLAEMGLPDTDEGRRQYCYRIACNMLRVDEINLGVGPGHGGPEESTEDYTARVREAFTAFVNAQRDRWRQESVDALELLRSLPEGVTA